jgi:tetratricopeptide (TPR) repeat protein
MMPAVVGPGRAPHAIGFVVCVACVTCLTGCVARVIRADRGRADSLASYVARVRALTQEAKPRPSPSVQTVESWDPRLSAALVELAAVPTGAQHRRVAAEYRRLGILDQAFAHLTAAVKLDATDASAFDGLARIWRDWGFPELGLRDAYRAVELAPASAAAANTLGTLLHAQGRIQDASLWYERALKLDPGATYAVNNLCYSSIVTQQEGAVGSCQRAAALAPKLKAAQNNLALAYAASGSFELARKQLEQSGDPAVAEYNSGILYLADRQYAKAAAAFDAALKINPHFDLAHARARQARAGAVVEE